MRAAPISPFATYHHDLMMPILMTVREQEYSPAPPGLKNWPAKCSAKETTFHTSSAVGWNHALIFNQINLIISHIKPLIFISFFL
jgi:hypothetical protein